MPNKGDSFTIELKPAHMKWGIYRYTYTRDHIRGEGYIPIPRTYARQYHIYNSNKSEAETEYESCSADGIFHGILLAQGCSRKGDVYAKQFAEKGHLKGIGIWYRKVNAQVGDYVHVEWISKNKIVLQYIRRIHHMKYHNEGNH